MGELTSSTQGKHEYTKQHQCSCNTCPWWENLSDCSLLHALALGTNQGRGWEKQMTHLQAGSGLGMAGRSPAACLQLEMRTEDFQYRATLATALGPTMLCGIRVVKKIA